MRLEGRSKVEKNSWDFSLKHAIYSPTFSTSQGNLMVSPATNLNVSDREIKLGSFLCVVTGNKKK